MNFIMTTIQTAAVAAIAAMGLALGATTATAGDAAAGKTAYDMNCATCHGALGDADTPIGKALKPPPRDFSEGEFKFDADKDGTPGTDADLALVIKNGAGKYGGSPLMAPWATLSDTDIQNVVAYIRTLKK